MHFVKMYSADWCYDCKEMLSFFEQNQIAYTVYHVDRDKKAVKRLQTLCGGKKIVPTLEIEGKVFINPSINEIQQLL